MLAILLSSVGRCGADEAVGGIGLVLAPEKETQSVKILRVLPDSPAAKAGLVAGSVLHKIGDTVVDGKPVTNCVALIRGPVGTRLTLEVIDPDAHATNRVELTRARIDPATAKPRMGDPAAPLSIKEWIQGGPVNVRDGHAVYVVEFWATWCGPCRVSIPHLSALQKKMKDRGVVVLGISDEAPATVKPFVQKMSAQMDYVVACDRNGETAARYLSAYGLNSIPTAFIVGKDGRIVWYGHPMAGLDKALDQMLASKAKP